MKSLATHEYTTEVATAAKWVLDRKDKTPNWNWWVFSRHNPDTEGLKYPDIICFHIINILAAKGLLDAIDGQPSQYSLNLSDMEKWEDIQHVPDWFERNILFPLDWAWRHFWIFIFWILSLVTSSGLTYLIEKWIDSKYP
jgi:hypothetical protein